MTRHKNFRLAVFAGIVGTMGAWLGAQGSAPATPAKDAARSKATSAKGDEMPMFQYDTTWPKMPLPNNWALGNVVGVGVDTKDHIWIVHRPHTLLHNYEDGLEQEPPTAMCCKQAPPIIEFDFQGNVIQSWGGLGHDYPWPDHSSGVPGETGSLSSHWNGEHTVEIDSKGNVWIGNNSAQNDAFIAKFSHDGKFLLSIGKLTGHGGGSNDTTALGKPAGIKVDPKTNEVYVADGYGNRRVIVFDGDTGAYKRHWGAYGNKPDDAAPRRYVPGGAPSQQFSTAHGIGLSKDGLVYLADRGNCRVQVFKTDGTYVNEVMIAPNTPQGSAFDVAFSPDAAQRFMYVLDGRNEKVWILRRSDLKTLGSFGHGGHFAGGLTTAHNLAADSKGNLYVTESGEGKRVQRFLYKGLTAVR